MNLYFLAVAIVAVLGIVATEEVRIAAVRVDLRHAKAQLEDAQLALETYRLDAAAEVARRLRDNAEREAAKQKELDDARQDYARRLGAIHARRLRNTAPSASNSSTVSAPARREPRAVDATADDNGLPRCVREDRRTELEVLLAEADINTAKLIECQRSIR